MMPISPKERASAPKTSDARTRVEDAQLLGDYPDLLTIQHLHEITGLAEQTLRGEINDGRLPGCRIGRRLYVPKPLFIGYIEKGGGLNG